MLLTIRTTHQPATDLGYLMGKNPARAQSFDVPSGQSVQPAVKCWGREYLRLIYGPEYTLPEHVERFAAGEPLRRVHDCVFGVLARESEPVDPRL